MSQYLLSCFLRKKIVLLLIIQGPLLQFGVLVWLHNWPLAPSHFFLYKCWNPRLVNFLYRPCFFSPPYLSSRCPPSTMFTRSKTPPHQQAPSYSLSLFLIQIRCAFRKPPLHPCSRQLFLCVPISTLGISFTILDKICVILCHCPGL